MAHNLLFDSLFPQFSCVVGRIIPRPTQIPGTCEYVLLHGKRKTVDVIELKVLRWGECPGLSRWTQCNCKALLTKRSRQESQRWDVPTEAEVGVMWFAEKDRSQGIQAASWCQEKPREHLRPFCYLNFSSWNTYWTPDLQDCKIINLHNVKPLKFVLICNRKLIHPAKVTHLRYQGTL